MIWVANFVLVVAFSLLLIPTGMIFLETLLARPKRERLPAPPEGARCVLLVPAHNEAAGLGATLERLKAQALATDILVVADNCDDDTAALARAAGVEVIERDNAEQRGKGYALHFGVQHLTQNPPDFVLIIDADCDLVAGSRDILVATAAATGLPVQARYEMERPSTETDEGSTGQIISEFAWAVMNIVRKQGLHRLGAPTRMNGTGMCLPWAAIGAANLNHGHLVEDLVMGLELSEKGFAGVYCDAAIVRSVFPVQAEGEMTQRQRWEHGTLQVMAAWGPRLALKVIKKPSLKTAAQFADLTIPPVTILLGLVLAACIIGGLFAGFTGLATPLGLALVALVLSVLGLIIAYSKIKHNLSGAIRLTALIQFVGLKLKVYNPAKKGDGWVRTSRDDGNSS